jgi:hypothetical protein
MDVVLILVVIGVFAMTWFAFAVGKTASQRDRLLSLTVDAAVKLQAQGNLGWRGIFADYMYVSFERHLRAVATFQDPYALYPNTIRSLGH